MKSHRINNTNAFVSLCIFKRFVSFSSDWSNMHLPDTCHNRKHGFIVRAIRSLMSVRYVNMKYFPHHLPSKNLFLIDTFNWTSAIADIQRIMLSSAKLIDSEHLQFIPKSNLVHTNEIAMYTNSNNSLYKHQLCR